MSGVAGRAPDRAGRHGPALEATGRMQAHRPRRPGRSILGFRRCQAPYCRVSRTRVVWPSEWRIAVPVWGLVHLECRPTPAQLRAMRIAAAMHRLHISFQANIEPMRRAIAGIQQAAAGLDLPEPEQWERNWEQSAHHWVANPGRIRQDTSHPDES
jgi:hypothetical protein